KWDAPLTGILIARWSANITGFVRCNPILGLTPGSEAADQREGKKVHVTFAVVLEPFVMPARDTHR
ncbi:MAG: hypothetical protein ACM37Z_20490, partial [Deltaproteobacteria bacterium]